MPSPTQPGTPSSPTQLNSGLRRSLKALRGLPHRTRRPRHRALWGIILGPILALALYQMLPAELNHDARLTAGATALMVTWWITQAVPIPATALLPLVIFPALTDTEMNTIGASYSNSVIFLFMGGFVLALAMQRWQLHRRLALRTLRMVGTRSTMVVAGFMGATALLSMWVSNTATAVMMIPIGVSVLGLAKLPTNGSPSPRPGQHHVPPPSNFGTALVLGIAYSATLGSLTTIISTPPNILLAGYLAEVHGISIGFGQWMLVGVPLSIAFLTITWFLLTKVLYPPEIPQIPGGDALIAEEIAKLGPASSGEKRVTAIFALAVASWVFLPLVSRTVFEADPPISDAGIAVTIALLLFIMPAGRIGGPRLMDWETAVELPWGILLLFGGGLALSAQFTSSGLTDWIASKATALAGVPVPVMVFIVAGVVLVFSELTSNSATAATFLPVAGGVALGLDINPLLLALPVAMASTCSFMLPIATPPNAIAYSSGYVSMGRMARAGFFLNLVSLTLVPVAVLTLASWVFGISY